MCFSYDVRYQARNKIHVKEPLPQALNKAKL
jgi:hypothetical protein